jgi:hypothetical protein
MHNGISGVVAGSGRRGNIDAGAGNVDGVNF